MPRIRNAAIGAKRGALALTSVLLLAPAACSPPDDPGSNEIETYTCPGCNVVLISMDTLRRDHVGAYGYDRETTPGVDALAARGVLFENAVSQSSWTRPAHMSVFTGLHPAEHGVTALAHRRRIDDTVPTLAGELGAAGYATAAFVGGVNMAAAFGFDQGFDSYRSNGKYFRDNLEDAKYWLERNAHQRFFLFFHGYDPHTPYLTDPVDRLALDLPDRTPRHAYRRLCKKARRARIKPYLDEYDGAIRRGDRYVGKLLAHLRELDLLDDAVIVLTSDHGEEFLEHGRCFHLTTLYREVLDVPLIIVAPGLTASRVPDLVPASVSVGATILDIVGVERHALPGPSLMPLVAGATAPAGPVVSETMRRMEGGRGQGHVRALTAPGEKLVHWITQNRYEYFDLASDPLEENPIEDGPRVRALAVELDRWANAHALRGDDDGALDHDPQLAEQLKSLGYVE